MLLAEQSRPWYPPVRQKNEGDTSPSPGSCSRSPSPPVENTMLCVSGQSCPGTPWTGCPWLVPAANPNSIPADEWGESRPLRESLTHRVARRALRSLQEESRQVLQKLRLEKQQCFHLLLYFGCISARGSTNPSLLLCLSFWGIWPGQLCPIYHQLSLWQQINSAPKPCYKDPVSQGTGISTGMAKPISPLLSLYLLLLLSFHLLVLFKSNGRT